MARRFEKMDMVEQVKYQCSVEMLLHFIEEDLKIEKMIGEHDGGIVCKHIVKLVRERINGFFEEYPRHVEIPMGASLEHTDDFDGNPLTLI